MRVTNRPRPWTVSRAFFWLFLRGQDNLPFTRPKEHRLAGQLRAVVTDDRRQRALLHGLAQGPGQSTPKNGRVHQLANTLSAQVIHDVQDTESAPRGQLIRNEVQRPALVHPVWQCHRRPLPHQSLAQPHQSWTTGLSCIFVPLDLKSHTSRPAPFLRTKVTSRTDKFPGRRAFPGPDDRLGST